MNKYWITLSLTLILAAGLCPGQDAVDNNVKGALIDIAKYESQFAGQTSANPSTVKRTLKLLTLTRQRLDGSPNKTHASWIDADKRYHALAEQLNQLLNPGAPPKSSSSAAVASPQPPSSPRSQATPPSTNSAPKQMISQYRVRIKKMARDMESNMQSMDKAGVKPFQDSEYVAQYQKSANGFREALSKYSEFHDDPDVVATHAKLAEYENMIAFGQNHAAKELAELGDVQAQLAAMDQTMHNLKLPPAPQEPYGEGVLNQWISDLIPIRQKAIQVFEPLPQIKERAHLPVDRLTVGQGGAYDYNDVLRIESGLTDVVSSIDKGVKDFTAQLDNKLRILEQGLAYYEDYDPTNSDHQSNYFLQEGRADEIRSRLGKDLTTANEATSFAKRLNHDTYAARVALVTKVQATLDQYEANYQKARELVRMPKAATKDSKLTKIAKETLANYDYVGEIERMVINTEKVHRSKETSEEKYDDIDVSLSGTVTLTGTKTTYYYEWDQFQVATAEPVGGKYYIFYNTLKYFTQGASTTPLNQWIISGRLQSSEIPKANISKD